MVRELPGFARRRARYVAGACAVCAALYTRLYASAASVGSRSRRQYLGMVHLAEATTVSEYVQRYARCGCDECLRALAELRAQHVGATWATPELRQAWLDAWAGYLGRRIRAGLDVAELFPAKQAPKPAVEPWSRSGWRGYGPPSGRIA